MFQASRLPFLEQKRGYGNPIQLASNLSGLQLCGLCPSKNLRGTCNSSKSFTIFHHRLVLCYNFAWHSSAHWQMCTVGSHWIGIVLASHGRTACCMLTRPLHGLALEGCLRAAACQGGQWTVINLYGSQWLQSMALLFCYASSYLLTFSTCRALNSTASHCSPRGSDFLLTSKKWHFNAPLYRTQTNFTSPALHSFGTSS